MYQGERWRDGKVVQKTWWATQMRRLIFIISQGGRWTIMMLIWLSGGGTLTSVDKNSMGCSASVGVTLSKKSSEFQGRRLGTTDGDLLRVELYYMSNSAMTHLQQFNSICINVSELINCILHTTPHFIVTNLDQKNLVDRAADHPAEQRDDSISSRHRICWRLFTSTCNNPPFCSHLLELQKPNCIIHLSTWEFVPTRNQNVELFPLDITLLLTRVFPVAILPC